LVVQPLVCGELLGKRGLDLLDLGGKPQFFTVQRMVLIDELLEFFSDSY
jgi:hypothetical protein